MNVLSPAPPIAKQRAKVFISYSRKDSAFAGRLLDALNARGFEAYLDKKDILPGEPWQERLGELIRIADTVIFTVSPNAGASKICAWEVEESLRMGKRVLPVVWQRTDHVPEGLKRLNYIYFDSSGLFTRRRAFNASLEQLIGALDRDIAWIREHTRLGELARRWKESGESSSATLRGEAIAAAEQWLQLAPATAETPHDLGLHRAYIAASRSTNDKEEEDKKRNIDRFLISQSRFLADRANQQIESGDAVTGLALALEGLTNDDGPIARPFVIDAAAAVQRALTEQREKLVLKGHARPIQTCCLSPDLEHAYTASDDGTTRKWCTRTGAELWSRPIEYTTFDQKAGLAVGVEDHRRLHIYRLSDGELIRKIDTGLINHARPDIDPKGELIAWFDGKNKSAFIWDIATGQARELPGRGGTIEQVVFSRNPLPLPVGRLAATLEKDGTVVLWDLTSGTVRTVIESNVERPSAICFNSFGTKLAVAGESGHTRLFDLKSSEPEVKFAIQDCPIRHIEFTASTRLLTTAAGLTNGHLSAEAVRILDVESGETKCSIGGHDEALLFARFLGTPLDVITASWDGTARIWNSVTGELVDILRGHDAGVTWCDGSRKMLITGSHDETARIWDLGAARKRAPAKVRNEDFGSVLYDVPGRLRARRQVVYGEVWISEAGSRDEIAKLHGAGHLIGASFSPDGNRILLGNGEVWDIARAERLYALEGHDGPISEKRFSPDGSRIVTVGTDGTVRTWDADSGKGLIAITATDVGLNSAAFDADARRVVSADRSGHIRLWDATSGKELLSIVKEGFDVRDARFSPDGKRLVTGSGRRLGGIVFPVDVWSAGDGSHQLAMPGHEVELTQVMFTPGGNFIVSVSWDNTIRIWSAASGAELGRLRVVDDPNAPVTAREDEDGSGLYLTVHASSRDERYRWHVIVERDRLIAAARSALPRSLTPAQRDRHFLPPEPPRWCIDQRKWPYNAAEWQQWLAEVRAGGQPVLPPDAPRWQGG